VTFGAVALRALTLVESHGLKLASATGRLYPWCGRSLLPLYHPSRLGRANRPAADQERDVAVLRPAVVDGRIDRERLAEAVR
jgi:hypothetical protein